MGESEDDTRASVLIVDDHLPSLTALRALLEPLGHRVHAAASGEAALDELRRREVAVVVMDVHMPGLDGLEVTRRIRSSDRNRAVPIILVTAADRDTSQLLEGYAAGAVDYVHKPYEPTILRSKVATLVELHQRREEVKREIAAHAKAEAARAAAEQASREKDEFLSLLSHELRTPLTTILLWSDMLLNRSWDALAARKGLQAIDACAKHEARIVDNVLEMSRIVTGHLVLEPSTVDLPVLIADVVRRLGEIPAERKVSVEVSATPAREDWHIDADGERLKNVLYNLLSNAVRFTPPGGSVRLSLAKEAGAFVTISVTDTGEGFDAEEMAALFQPFRPVEARAAHGAGGLGLGLPVARALVELHGGTLTAASAGRGCGASFVVRLPVAAPALHAAMT